MHTIEIGNRKGNMSIVMMFPHFRNKDHSLILANPQFLITIQSVMDFLTLPRNT